VSPSIFSGLSLARAAARIDISYPRALHELARARSLARAHGLEVREGDAQSWRLSLEDPAPYPAALKAFFAELNDLPRLPAAGALAACEAPLVSCIVVVNENWPFVAEQFLPALAACSSRHPIELILAWNGSRAPQPPSPEVRVVASQWGAVSRAYNAGAALARGAWLAFFHDDCLVCDPLWIEKCLQRVARGAHAVAGEYRQIGSICGVAVPALPVAKCVPLFVSRADFAGAGGFDERHYIGYEDLDFTLALASRGRKLVATNLDVVHFHGMSSTLKYYPVPGLADLFALGAVPRFAVMRRFNEFWRAVSPHPGVAAMRSAMDAQLLYVLVKYEGMLSGIDAAAYGRARAALERQLAAAGAPGTEAAVERLRALDPELAARAGA
jgi:hypothetical protein